jgi:hypothetical protein
LLVPCDHELRGEPCARCTRRDAAFDHRRVVLIAELRTEMRRVDRAFRLRARVAVVARTGGSPAGPPLSDEHPLTHSTTLTAPIQLFTLVPSECRQRNLLWKLKSEPRQRRTRGDRC